MLSIVNSFVTVKIPCMNHFLGVHLFEIINEYDCQAAVFFIGDKIYSLFEEKCQKIMILADK